MSLLAASAPRRLVVDTGTLLVRADAPAIPGGSFLVEDGRVAAVGRRDDFAEGDERLDLTHRVVSPGLVDSHVHVEFDPMDDDLLVINQYREDREDAVLAGRAVVNLRSLLASGVTTVRDCASSVALLRLRDRLASGQIDVATPRLLACGLPLTVTAGHLAWVGLRCDSPDRVRAATRRVIAHGADAVKVVTSGGTMTAGSNPSRPQFSAEELRIVVTEAHRLGKRVVAHALNAVSIASCVEAGVDSVDHVHWAAPDGGDGFDVSTAEALVRRGTNVGMTGSGWTRDLLAEDPEALIHRFRHHRTLREMGAHLTLHTDAGSTGTAFDGIVASMRVLMAATDCSAAEALWSVTEGGAQAIGKDDVGHLEPGAHADFIATMTSPADDLAALDAIDGVYLGADRKSVAADR